LKKEQKLLVETEQIDAMANKPLELGIEALIATIEDKEELIRAIIETRRKRT
jgi:hypothetical protein